jgi:hypothetical protein
MKRFFVAVLCALVIGSVCPRHVRANPRVYDTPPSDGRASVGDDDTPIPARWCEPLSATARPEPQRPGSATSGGKVRIVRGAVVLKFGPWFSWVRNVCDRVEAAAAVACERR